MAMAGTGKRGDGTTGHGGRRFPSEMHRRQRGKNLALAAVLAGLVALFYIVAIVRMSGG